MSPNSSALTLVRQFQSETDAIREAPEPRWARITVFVLAGMLVSLLVITVVTRMDRVITSQGRQDRADATSQCVSGAGRFDHPQHRRARGPAGSQRSAAGDA